MSLSYAAVFAAIENSSPTALWSPFLTMNEEEMVMAATAIGPQRLRDLLHRFVGQSTGNPARATPFALAPVVPAWSPAVADPARVLPAVLSVAFKDHRYLGAAHNFKVLADIQLRLDLIRYRRAEAPKILLLRDVTRTLPSPTMCPAPLNDIHFADVATRQNISVAAIKAVAHVESGGRSGFDDQFRPKILFEAHHFRKHTHRRFDLTHPHLSCKRQAAKQYYSWDQYGRLFEAMVLDPVAAIMSASWGKFQVLGANHNGWPDPVSFAQTMFESEATHLRTFEAYCVTHGLIIHLRNKHWAKFAEGYNGANYKEYEYDTKIAKAYAKYGGT